MERLFLILHNPASWQDLIEQQQANTQTAYKATILTDFAQKYSNQYSRVLFLQIRNVIIIFNCEH